MSMAHNVGGARSWDALAHVAAHDAKRQPGLVILHGKRRNDGVERPLGRLVRVRVRPVLNVEHFAAVLEAKAEAWDRELNARATRRTRERRGDGREGAGAGKAERGLSMSAVASEPTRCWRRRERTHRLARNGTYASAHAAVV